MTWFWVDISLSMRSWTYLKSFKWQGIIMVPCWSKPYSSSASFSSWENKGWLRYIIGITIFSCSSPCPTLIGKNPFGMSLITTFFLWGWSFVTGTSPNLFSSLSHIRREQRVELDFFYQNFFVWKTMNRLKGFLLVINTKCSNVRKCKLLEYMAAKNVMIHRRGWGEVERSIAKLIKSVI